MHPIADLGVLALYAGGALMWISLMGGFTRPRRGMVLTFIGECLSTLLWPLAIAICAGIWLTSRK